MLSNGKDSLRFYLDAIAGSEPLSREREVALAAQIRQGDTNARDVLVQANLRFVVSTALKYQHRGLPLADLISAGNVGLLTAAERFDGTKGWKFISYAVWWIRQAILLTLAEQTRTVRLPINRIQLLQHISKAGESLGQVQEENVEVEEIAAMLDRPVQEIMNALRSACAVLSLDEVLPGEVGYCLEDILPDTDQEPPDAEAIRGSDQSLLTLVLSTLDAREQYIIRLHYGLDGEKAHTLEEIGALLGVTRERIRQIRNRALDKLRHPSQAGCLQILADKI